MLRPIITGSTGMVGEGVLHVCLNHPEVEEVLMINRKPCGVTHFELTEIIHQDFYDFSAIEDKLKGYNACFFCLGVTSVGKGEEEYTKLTYTLTMHVAETLARINPKMTFCYISGAGTDSTEKGRVMWARVKGKTENDLIKLPFDRVYAFRPGFIKPIPGMKHTHGFYRFINWMFPIGRALAPNGFCTLRELGLAMIHSTKKMDKRAAIEGKEIISLGKGG